MRRFAGRAPGSRPALSADQAEGLRLHLSEHSATGYMGVSPAACDTEALQHYVEEFAPAAVARDQLEHGTAELSTYQGGRVRRALDNAVQAALTGQMSPADALSQAQREADAALRRYAR